MIFMLNRSSPKKMKKYVSAPKVCIFWVPKSKIVCETNWTDEQVEKKGEITYVRYLEDIWNNSFMKKLKNILVMKLKSYELLFTNNFDNK